MRVIDHNIRPRGEVCVIERDASGKETNRWQFNNCIMNYGMCIMPMLLAGSAGLPASFPGRQLPSIAKIKYGYGRPLGAGASSNTPNNGIDYKFQNVVDPDASLSDDIDAIETDAASAIATVYSDVVVGREDYITPVVPYYIRLRKNLHMPYAFQLTEQNPFNPELIRGNVTFDARWVNIYRPQVLQQYQSGYQYDYPMPPQSEIGNAAYKWMGANTLDTSDDIVENLKDNVPQAGEMEWSVTFRSVLDVGSRIIETAGNSPFVSDDGLTFQINEIGLFADFPASDRFVTPDGRSYPLSNMFAQRYTPAIVKKRSMSLEWSWKIIF